MLCFFHLAPTQPSNLVLQTTGTTSINASWAGGLQTCIGFYELCFQDPVSDTTNCTNTTNTYLETTVSNN